MHSISLSLIGNNKVIILTRILLTVIFLTLTTLVNAQVAINSDGTTPHISAMLDIKASNLGFLPPRVTFANRPVNPATGLMIYQTDGSNPGYYFFDGLIWQRFGSALADYWLPTGQDIYFSSGRVSIGSTTSENNGLKVTNYLNGKAAVKGNVEIAPNIFASGMLGALGPVLMGVPFSVMNVGVLGIKPNAGNNGAAIYGWNNDDNASNYSGIFITDGASVNNNYALYAEARGAAINYAGQFKGRVLIEGNNGNSASADSLSTLLSVQVRHSQPSDSRAIEGISLPKPGYGVGIKGSGGWKGIYGEANGAGYSGWVYGVQGLSTSGLDGTAVGVYGSATGGNVNWAGYFDGECFIANGLKVNTQNTQTPALMVQGKIYGYDLILADAYPLLKRINDYERPDNQTINKPEFVNKEISPDNTDDINLSILDLNEALVKRIEALTSAISMQNLRIRELELLLQSMVNDNQSSLK
ncbi:MAG: hypothetical protein IPH84_09660 [Bacteroidales bacterium]|nr:hypothetical protein [Bacteroidales bacterium]